LCYSVLNLVHVFSICSLSQWSFERFAKWWTHVTTFHCGGDLAEISFWIFYPSPDYNQLLTSHRGGYCLITMWWFNSSLFSVCFILSSTKDIQTQHTKWRFFRDYSSVYLELYGEFCSEILLPLKFHVAHSKYWESYYLVCWSVLWSWDKGRIGLDFFKFIIYYL
jgi:hypothetical protein